MTVSELIEILQRMPKDAEVYLPSHENAISVLCDEKYNEVEIRWD